ncbi:MAG: TetR/AcrR family transcriptional regulator [Oscillospiraceae bacterium]|nr:TetR/AcrR family transcriptional regulator [Oscillospiraceae bacterium]
MEHQAMHTAAAYRRRRQIEDCLYENMQHVPYQSISVADICRQVGISRKAYYNYYHDKDACLYAVVDRVIRDCTLHCTTNTPDDASMLESSVILLEYWKQQKPFFDMILRNNLFYVLIERFANYVQQENRTILRLLDTPELSSDGDILACYVSCQLTLVLQWYLRGFDTPAEEMAQKYLRLFHSPLILPPEA